MDYEKLVKLLAELGDAGLEGAESLQSEIENIEDDTVASSVHNGMSIVANLYDDIESATFSDEAD